MGPRADTDTDANFKTLHSLLESTCASEVVQTAQMLMTHLPCSRNSIVMLPEPYPTILASFNPTVHVFRSFSCIICFSVSFSCCLPLTLYVPVSLIFTFLLSSSTISFCFLRFLNPPLFVQIAINAIRAIENIPLIATVYSVNDKVIRVWKQWKPQNALLRQCAYRNTKYSIGPYFFRFPCENCVGNSQSNCIKEQSDGTCFLHFSCIQT